MWMIVIWRSSYLCKYMNFFKGWCLNLWDIVCKMLSWMLRSHCDKCKMFHSIIGCHQCISMHKCCFWGRNLRCIDSLFCLCLVQSSLRSSDTRTNSHWKCDYYCHKRTEFGWHWLWNPKDRLCTCCSVWCDFLRKCIGFRSIFQCWNIEIDMIRFLRRIPSCKRMKFCCYLVVSLIRSFGKQIQ